MCMCVCVCVLFISRIVKQHQACQVKLMKFCYTKIFGLRTVTLTMTSHAMTFFYAKQFFDMVHGNAINKNSMSSCGLQYMHNLMFALGNVVENFHCNFSSFFVSLSCFIKIDIVTYFLVANVKKYFCMLRLFKICRENIE